MHDHDDNFELYSESSFQPDYYYDEEEYGNLPTCGQGNDTANDECDDTVTGGQQAETLSGPGNAPAGAKGFAARFQAKSDMGPKVRDDIADGLKVMLSERLSIENMETIMDKYVPPKNVPHLGKHPSKIKVQGFEVAKTTETTREGYDSPHNTNE